MIQFQSTHPHGVRPSDIRRISSSVKFQSTHPHGVRPLLKSVMFLANYWFQSTHPHGVRRNPRIVALSRDVSIHAPTRGATYAVFALFIRVHVVSIHAPTRGATLVFFTDFDVQIVSIHAPTRGATIDYANQPGRYILFQSTHPHGVRPLMILWIIIPYIRFQSTHPHGVRQIIDYPTSYLYLRFNPRTHTGCDY